ncbi:MAG: TIGR03364 family FAD-dependent oxidoreductase [Gomphosphaeria aponina SAG 52.96 = DSM 107014]|uniref:TIGR03364 family FAD-dependent oxidoreductase n=1 Tax=Gomphosphaeria aponina SAG 52.96 = DSM 107014 TaxID=1521640 RepID=A0A941GQT6_9CHRO|nr:TIGR03364 family FAD-dependent oxidoreductase [Gomphosphaeria aponina SAG 52.96 = DSM 107014]
MTKNLDADVLIIGAGIVGLANALAYSKRGFKVIVFERNAQAVGASIRNFGMVWPIGQPAGNLYNRALNSRKIWLDLAEKANFYASQDGSLHLVYRQDELGVIEEFVSSRPEQQNNLKLLTVQEVEARSQAVNFQGLLGGLWSSTEVIVDPREALKKIPQYLAETYLVDFEYGTAITNISYPQLVAGEKTWRGDKILVCSGTDFETLYPEIFAKTEITKVKLQMMRTVVQPNQWKLGPALCGGLTLTHYTAFAHCPSLPLLKERIAQETPHFPQWGIHVMMSQNGLGELIIGDTHESGLNPDPFDKIELNDYVLDYLKTFANVPVLKIAETWHGIYGKLPQKTELILHPEQGVTIINGLGGAGMTLSFGLAEEIMQNEDEELIYV